MYYIYICVVLCCFIHVSLSECISYIWFTGNNQCRKLLLQLYVIFFFWFQLLRQHWISTKSYLQALKKLEILREERGRRQSNTETQMALICIPMKLGSLHTVCVQYISVCVHNYVFLRKMSETSKDIGNKLHIPLFWKTGLNICCCSVFYCVYQGQK